MPLLYSCTGRDEGKGKSRIMIRNEKRKREEDDEEKDKRKKINQTKQIILHNWPHRMCGKFELTTPSRKGGEIRTTRRTKGLHDRPESEER